MIIENENMDEIEDRNFLNRFTSLPILLHMLSKKCITLTNPKEWEDRNDAYYLEKYKDDGGYETLLASCFSGTRETFHHWKIFASGTGGVCVEFKWKELLEALDDAQDIRGGWVHYRLIDENKNPPLKAWPFLKRIPFRDEAEFRIIYQSSVECDAIDIAIPLSCIRKITLSPWLNGSVAQSVTEIIRSVQGCEDIKVISSSLLENRRWRKCLEGAGAVQKRLSFKPTFKFR